MDLIAQTFHDIVAFVLLYLLILSAFASVLFIFNEKKKIETGTELFTRKIGNEIIDAMIVQYLLGLGEFEIDQFTGTD